MRDLLIENDRQPRRITVRGVVDLTTAHDLCARIDAAQAPPPTALLLDLDGVELLPARVVGLIDGAVRRAESRDISVSLVAHEGCLARRVLDVLDDIQGPGEAPAAPRDGDATTPVVV